MNSLNPDINATIPTKTVSLGIELGDIIEIIATNEDLNGYVFYVDYIDTNQLRIINVSTLNTVHLSIDDEGVLSDTSISAINLLNRSDTAGYARQHKLLPQTWVDIHFGGEIPVIFTGEITNLEEDMIELTTYPTMKVIYIDFAYKGVPLHLPIDKIVIRDKPKALDDVASLLDVNVDDMEIEEETQASMETTDTGESVIHIPEGVKADHNPRDALHAMYIDTRDLFMEDLGTVKQLVEVAEHEKRYTLENQLANMTDVLLSDVEEYKRNETVLNQIHFILTRFKQLRETFSHFDENGIVTGNKTVGSFAKPIVDKIMNMGHNLKWIVPVVATRKKMYVDQNLAVPNAPDYDIMDTAVELETEAELFETFKNKSTVSEENRYDAYLEKSDVYHTPFISPSNDSCLTPHHTVVQTAIEGIIQTLSDFQSTVVANGSVARRRFVTQRYQLGETRIASTTLRSGRRVVYRQPITSANEICVQSLLMFPDAVVQYSRAHGVASSILEKASLGNRPFLLHRALKPKTLVHTETVGSLSHELEYEGEMAVPLMEKIVHFVLDEDVVINPQTTFQQFLHTIFPKTRLFIKYIRQYVKNELTFKDFVDHLEPFGITADEVTFDQFMEVRYFVGKQVEEYKKTMVLKQKEFLAYVTTQFNVPISKNRILQTFDEKTEMTQWMREAYRLANTDAPDDKSALQKLSSSELLSQLYQRDGAQLYTKMVNYLLLSLITPDKILDAVRPSEVEETPSTEGERVQTARDCTMRVLAKKYNSVTALQRDNNKDAFYDKEYDDTPYGIVDKYKREQKEMMPEIFISFLKQALVDKHDCPPELADVMAKTLIAKQKQIREGEYAILEVYPQLPAHIQTQDLSREQLDEIHREQNIRVKREYYKRVGDVWMHDNSVNEETFIDTNMLFCNLNENCVYDNAQKLGDKCVDKDVASMRRRIQSQNKIVAELDRRFTMTVDELEKHLSDTILQLRRDIRNKIVYRETQRERPNNVAVMLGKQVQTGNASDTAIISPYANLLDLILGQDDFVTKQFNITRFVEQFTRDAMKTELNEDTHWRYCIQTNVRLVPQSIYALAKTFVMTPEKYNETLDRLCGEVGKKSDNVVVDKYSGWTLRLLDYQTEDAYTDEGQKVKSHDIMEKDLATLIQEAKSKRVKVFEDETTQKVYNIFSVLSTNMGISPTLMDGGLEEFVLRISLEMIHNKIAVIIPSETDYLRHLAKMREKQGKKGEMLPYKTHCDQLIVIIVACALFIRIQTMVPSFTSAKTYPGCVKSFRGYPMDGGVENTSGLKYIACILHKIKGSHADVWKAVVPISADGFEKRMLKLIQDFFLKHPDIQHQYVLKRAYLEMHPDVDVPDSVSVGQKWVHFQPPILPSAMGKSLQGISADYESEIKHAMATGSSQQHEMISVLKTKLLKHAYGIVEIVNHVVQSKDAVFVTASNIPYLQNACCNEDITKLHPLSYFIAEDANIDVYIKKSVKMASLLHYINVNSKCSMFYHEPNTANVYPILPTGYELKSVFEAFIHYCKFDSDVPIPRDLLSVCNSKPVDYDRHWSITEKIDALRRTGKNYTVENLYELMQLVTRRNIMSPTQRREISLIDRFRSVLDELDMRDSVVIEEPLRRRLWKMVEAFQPHVMIDDQTDDAELQTHTRSLNAYLQTSNNKMLAEILKFMNAYSRADYNKLEGFITRLMEWNIQPANARKTHTMYNQYQYIKNEVHALASVIPSMVANGGHFDTIPKHWGLSKLHKMDVKAFVDAQLAVLEPFKQNTMMQRLFEETGTPLRDVLLFVDNLPLYAPIVKGGRAFYSFFRGDTVDLLLKYCMYSVWYEYIRCAKSNDMIRIDIQENRQVRRAEVAENAEVLLHSVLTRGAMGDDARERVSDMQEMEIVTGEREDLFRLVAKFLSATMKTAHTNKKMLDLTYTQITLGVGVTKMNEKKKITDFFENMRDDERKVNYLMKSLKLGEMWEQGLRKSVFQYDKKTYDKARDETAQFFVSDLQTFDIELPTTAVETGGEEGMTAEELDVADGLRADEEGEEEGNDISGLRSGFMDGDYYSEDGDDDDGFGDE